MSVRVRATALVRGQLISNWNGSVWVDAPGGNEDPFVFGPSWAYSYCHATQLRRHPGPRSFVQTGSYLIFCSGDLAAKKDVIAVDTVFVVRGCHRWRSPSTVPVGYQAEQAKASPLWRYHLRFGGQPGRHKGTYTYEARLHDPDGGSSYSFLPLDEHGDRVRAEIGTLGRETADRIRSHFHMRRPVPLEASQVATLLAALRSRVATEVVRDIEPLDRSFLALRDDGATRCAG
jgi:hypothetical protein